MLRGETSHDLDAQIWILLHSEW